MLSTLAQLLVTFALLWPGRDKVWTPTFEGTREERYVQAVNYYSERMGLEPPTIEILKPRLVIDGRPACFWVRRHQVFAGDVVGISTAPECRRLKPELYASHESCHRRLAHLDIQGLTSEQKHREVQACMEAYAAKERR